MAFTLVISLLSGASKQNDPKNLKNMKKITVTLVTIASLSSSAYSQRYDFTDDFRVDPSATSANGAWEYRYWNPGTGWELAFDGTGSGTYDSASSTTGAFPHIEASLWHSDLNEHARYGTFFRAPTTGTYDFVVDLENLIQGSDGSAVAQIGLFSGALGGAAFVGDVNAGESYLNSGQIDLNAGQIVQIWTGSGSDNVTNFDRIRVNELSFTIVPEPSSALLLSLAGCSFIARRKRK